MNNMTGQADYYISNWQHASGLTQEPEYLSDSEVAKPDRSIGTLEGSKHSMHETSQLKSSSTYIYIYIYI